ncbi:MAG: hypothetical protein OJF52_002244 [Nitrospira sp.]|nr:MAG: hypothetical protein OJF52_002244 [Nitrospira sp.]
MREPGPSWSGQALGPQDRAGCWIENSVASLAYTCSQNAEWA